jgi:two-component system, response regulator
MSIPHEIEILLVEDNPHDAELTQRALKKRKITNHIDWVKDGAEALDLFFGANAPAGAAVQCVPKVVLLDLKIPKVDGIEVLRRLKSNEQTKTIPIVVLTSSREQSDIATCYDLGVNSYLVKPVSFDDFIETVGQLGLYWLLLNEPPENCPPAASR